MAEYRVSADAAGQRLDKYVRRVLPELAQSAIYKLIRTKKIRVNGVRCEEGQLLVQDADLLFYYRNRLEDYGLRGAPRLFPVKACS